MMNQNAGQSISVQDVMEQIQASSILLEFLAIGIYFVSAVAVLRIEKDGAWAFYRMFDHY